MAIAAPSNRFNGILSHQVPNTMRITLRQNLHVQVKLPGLLKLVDDRIVSSLRLISFARVRVLIFVQQSHQCCLRHRRVDLAQILNPPFQLALSGLAIRCAEGVFFTLA